MESKKEKIISAVATIGIVLTLFGATYAYFASLVDAGKITDVEITANTVDVFSFETGDPVSLNINQENFASGKGNQTDSTFARAMLSANNKTNTATEHYYLYLSISNNTFTYSKDSVHPEILVKITDSDGNELVDSDVAGLTHKTVVDAQGNTVTGFDVTEKQGTITILNNREITTTSTKSETWTFTFTFVNYDFNQAANAGGNFSARVLIKKNGAIMSDVCKDGEKLSDCIIAMYGIDDRLYYHNGTIKSTNGTVIDANDNSYRYAGGNENPDYYACSYNNVPVHNYLEKFNRSLLGDCDTVYKISHSDEYYDVSIEEFYKEPISIFWDSENNVCLSDDGVKIYDYTGGDIYDPSFCTGVTYQYEDTTSYYAGIEKVGSGTETLYDSDNSLYTCEYNEMPVRNYSTNDYNSSSQGNCSTIYKISYQTFYVDKSYQNYGEEAISSATEVGTGTATLYEKAGGVYNYVCFGSDAATCPDDNLYRIIGVFGDQVKLIKWDYANSNLLGTDGDYSSDGTYSASYMGAKTTINEYHWNYTNSSSTYNATNNYNVWSYSELNTVNLNTNYLNNIGTVWENKIATTAWYVDGDTYDNIAYSEMYKAYQKSLYLQKNSVTYSAKIGLMDLSDYGFAANPEAWILELTSYYNFMDANWMYMGLYEWTMVREKYSSEYVYNIGATPIPQYANADFAVRPVFYLNADVEYVSGLGTKTNPIIIN